LPALIVSAAANRGAGMHEDVRQADGLTVSDKAVDLRRQGSHNVVDVRYVDCVGHGESQSRANQIALSCAAGFQLHRPIPAEHAEVKTAVRPGRGGGRSAVLSERKDGQIRDGQTARISDTAEQL